MLIETNLCMSKVSGLFLCYMHLTIVITPPLAIFSTCFSQFRSIVFSSYFCTTLQHAISGQSNCRIYLLKLCITLEHNDLISNYYFFDYRITFDFYYSKCFSVPFMYRFFVVLSYIVKYMFNDRFACTFLLV